jgi:hypothetical protein
MFQNIFIQKNDPMDTNCYFTCLANFLNNSKILEENNTGGKVGANIIQQNKLINKYSYNALNLIPIALNYENRILSKESLNFGFKSKTNPFFVLFGIVQLNNVFHSILIIKEENILHILDPYYEKSSIMNIEDFLNKYQVHGVSLVMDADGNPMSFNNIFLKHLFIC